MKKIALTLVSLIALALGTAGAGLTTASAAIPGNTLKIVRVGTDAMGADSFANRNREYVTFKNVSGADVDVAGVLVEDNWSHSNSHHHSCNFYKIAHLPGTSGTVLHANEYVTVFNGWHSGGDYRTGSEYRLYANSDTDCGASGHFFNNDADTVWVTKGDVTDSKSWDWNGGYYVR
jgi:hypothetical protein